MELVTSLAWTRIPAVSFGASSLAIIGLGVLAGLLLNDIQFDLSRNSDITRAYYCELLQAFTTVFGISRVLVPTIANGIAQLLLCLILPSKTLRSQQAALCSLFVIVGCPLMFASLSVTKRACEQPPTSGWSVGDEIRVLHACMLILFMYGLVTQVRILYSIRYQQLFGCTFLIA
jgi:hypothetical protein